MAKDIKQELDWPEICNKFTEESDDAYQAFLCYLELGRRRSLARAFHAYKIERGMVPKTEPFNAKVRQPTYFLDWSMEHKWAERKDVYDEWCDNLRIGAFVQRQRDVESREWSAFEELDKEWWKRWKLRLFEASKADGDPITNREMSDFINQRRMIDDMGRRAANMPERITQSQTDITSKGEKVQPPIETMEIYKETTD